MRFLPRRVYLEQAQRRMQQVPTHARLALLSHRPILAGHRLSQEQVPAAQWSEGQVSPSAAVFISDPDLQESTSRPILGALFELTPAEANLATLLARGLSLAQVSVAQNISQHTARAQLKSIFAKTGVSRQAELVRLVLKSVASLG